MGALQNPEAIHGTIGLFLKCFTTSLLETFRTVSGIDFNLVEDQQVDNQDSGLTVSGFMLLTGERNILLTLSLPWDTAITLVSFTAGISPDEISNEDVYDSIAEFTNMVAGGAKHMLAESENHFQLTTPFAVSGNDFSIFFRKNIESYLKVFKNEELQIYLNISFLK